MPSLELGRLRRLWFTVHQWIGLGLLVLLIPLGLTGSVLVWRQSLDRLEHPHRYVAGAGAASGPLARYVEAARGAFGETARPTLLRMPRSQGDPVVVMGRPRGEGGGGGPGPGRGGLSVWLDPTSARVLEVGSPQAGSTVAWVHRLHENLLLPGVGGQVVGWLGWAMLASSLTGLWLWWPRGPFLSGFRFRRTGETLINIHHLAGFWISLPLAILSATGVYLAFPQSSRAVVSAFAPMSAEPPRDGGRSRGESRDGPREEHQGGEDAGHHRHGGSEGSGKPAGPALTVDEAVAKALAAVPGAQLASVSLPGRRAPVWRIQGRGADAQPITVTVDDATGAVTRAPAPLPGDAVNQWMHRLHGGQQTSLLWQLILTLAGLAPALLGITGLIVWGRRQVRRARLRAT